MSIMACFLRFGFILMINSCEKSDNEIIDTNGIAIIYRVDQCRVITSCKCSKMIYQLVWQQWMAYFKYLGKINL